MRARKAGIGETLVGLLMALLMLSISVAVSAGDPLADPPVADPNGPYFGHAGDMILFDGSNSYDPDGGPIVMYEWLFGDGSTYQESVAGAPDGVFDGMTQYAYPGPGIYIVTLMVMDESGEGAYGETFAEITTPPSVIDAEIDFKPETLNLATEGKWMTCYIELPPPHDPGSIDVSTVAITEINGIAVNIPVEDSPTEIGDHDGDGIPDLMVKFDRGKVEDAAPIQVEIIELDLVGAAPAGASFSGSDTVKVVAPRVVDHERFPDGTHYWKFSDGIEYWKHPDGTEHWIHPDGTEHWIHPDGTEHWIHPDGTEHWTFPDGTEHWIHPDGMEHWIYPDGSELWIHPDGTRHWIRPDGTDVWIFPSDIARIRDLINNSKFLEAANETIIVYKINLTVTGKLPNGTVVTKTATISYDPNKKPAWASTARCGAITLGPGSFNRSVAWLASIIQHELVHVQQDAEDRWYLGPQGWALNEVEAYDHQLKTADQKGLTASEKAEIQKFRDLYYNKLNNANKKRADKGNYTLPKGQENT